MKRIVLILVSVFVITYAMAQDTFVATLEHNGEYTNFYNNTALTAAYNAAEDGDVITLSSGTFVCPNITKGVTIRGVGLSQLEEYKKTFISSDFDVYAQNASSTVNLEGLYLQNTMNIYSDGSAETAGTVNIIKTRCNAVNVLEKNTPTDTTTVKVNFYNCWMNGGFKSNRASYTDIKMMNCYINSRFETQRSEVSNTMFRNCYLEYDIVGGMHYSTFENCIICFSGDKDHKLPGSATAINSISFTINSGTFNYHSAFEWISYSENCSHLGQISDYKTVFSDQANFILQEEIAKEYLGTDGKEVGMYGGIGYTTKVRYPIISTLSIGNGQTTSREGKLDVTIELDRE